MRIRLGLALRSPLFSPHFSTLVSALLSALLLASCGHFLEDNGTHLASVLEQGVSDLRGSGARELVVKYETLDAPSQKYYVEITPSLDPARPAQTIWGSYLVVSGKTSGGTSYHNRFVFVPERLYVEKDQGGSTELVLRKQGDRVSVVEVR
jgi:hypothetical protein